jgi:enediyne core biosynthesis thioesterase
MPLNGQFSMLLARFWWGSSKSCIFTVNSTGVLPTRLTQRVYLTLWAFPSKRSAQIAPPHGGIFSSISRKYLMLTKVQSPSTARYDYSPALDASLLLPTPKPEALTFRHSIDIYLKDSNAYGNTYFARYFEWQGICRERWLQQCVSADLLQPQGVLITKNATVDYVRETFPFQTVDCELNSWQVKQCSLTLVFRFKVAGNIVCTGSQQIVFASHSKRIQRWPEHALANLRKYELSAERDTTLLNH